MSLATQNFVVPPLEGTPTGGTVFNRCLLESLGTLAVDVHWCSLDEALGGAESTVADYWLDTLYLQNARALRKALRAGQRLGALVHYLPSLLERGENVTRSQLTAHEKFVLDALDAFLVTSNFMRQVLIRLGVGVQRIVVVEPGRIATRSRGMSPSHGSGVRAVMVAHLLPNKGVLPFVQHLKLRLRPADRFELRLIGHGKLDTDYARAVTGCVAEHPQLRRQVSWLGELGPTDVIECMYDCNLFVSASTMESYGMALAEARTVGLPVLAHTGGNVASLVDAQSGGELVDSVEQLAESFLELCRNPGEVATRGAAAAARALAPRPWSEAARDFAAWLYAHENERANDTVTSNAPSAAAQTAR